MKLRTIAFAFAALLLSTAADADSGVRYAALGYQQLTSLGSATALTVPTGATTAFIQAEAQAVRYRDDGTDPSATVGQPLAVGALLIYTGPLKNIKFIEQTSGAKLDISYYK